MACAKAHTICNPFSDRAPRCDGIRMEKPFSSMWKWKNTERATHPHIACTQKAERRRDRGMKVWERERRWRVCWAKHGQCQEMPKSLKTRNCTFWFGIIYYRWYCNQFVCYNQTYYVHTILSLSLFLSLFQRYTSTFLSFFTITTYTLNREFPKYFGKCTTLQYNSRTVTFLYTVYTSNV